MENIDNITDPNLKNWEIKYIGAGRDKNYACFEIQLESKIPECSVQQLALIRGIGEEKIGQIEFNLKDKNKERDLAEKSYSGNKLGSVVYSISAIAQDYPTSRVFVLPTEKYFFEDLRDLFLLLKLDPEILSYIEKNTIFKVPLQAEKSEKPQEILENKIESNLLKEETESSKPSTEVIFSKKSKVIGKFRDIYGTYPLENLYQVWYRDGSFVVSSVKGDHKSKFLLQQNLSKSNLTNINKEIICDSNDNPVSTTVKYNFGPIYVLDKKGRLYVNEISSDFLHHDEFIVKEGFGKPVALAGHISIENGKVVEISNSTGHYKCNRDQLILGVKFLHELGVLDKNVKIKDCSHVGGDEDISLKDIIEIDAQEILKEYDTLETLKSDSIKPNPKMKPKSKPHK